MAHDAPKPQQDAAAVKAADVDNVNAIKTGEWQLGLFSCFNHIVPNCCMVYWLPCVSLAQISARLGVASYNLVLLTLVVLFLIFGVTDLLYTLAVLGAENDDGTNDIIDPITGFADTPLAIPAQLASLVYGMALAGLTVYLRVTTRTRFNIPGNICYDALASVCCNCCAMAQIASHVKSYKKGSCSFKPLDTLPAYPHDAQV